MDIPTESNGKRKKDIKCLLGEISIGNMITHLKFLMLFYFFYRNLLHFSLLKEIAIIKDKAQLCFIMIFHTRNV